SLTLPAPHPPLPSFPTRRSSDLEETWIRTADQFLSDADAIRSRLPEALDRLAARAALNLDCVEEVLQDKRIEQNAPESRSRTQRSEEHTSELQSLAYLVCRLLLE